MFCEKHLNNPAVHSKQSSNKNIAFEILVNVLKQGEPENPKANR